MFRCRKTELTASVLIEEVFFEKKEQKCFLKRSKRSKNVFRFLIGNHFFGLNKSQLIKIFNQSFALDSCWPDFLVAQKAFKIHLRILLLHDFVASRFHGAKPCLLTNVDQIRVILVKF